MQCGFQIPKQDFGLVLICMTPIFRLFSVNHPRSEDSILPSFARTRALMSEFLLSLTEDKT